VPLEWVYFFIFQIYDWVVNFPLLKFNIWRFSSYDKVKNWSVYLLWILVWISECATNKSDCHNITELQSMTLGFGTYKPFGPVHMRTLLARIHIHWPESKLTKSHINWKKVMKSDPWYHMFILLIKKNIWVSVWSSSSLFSLSSSLHSPSSSLSPLSYTGTCQICQTQHTTCVSLRSSLYPTWGKQVKTPPLFSE
jgi:hypothetical protein